MQRSFVVRRLGGWGTMSEYWSEYWSKTLCSKCGWVTFSADFRGMGCRPPTNVGDRKLESLGYHMALFTMKLHFSSLEGNTINRFKWNLAFKHKPWDSVVSTVSCRIWPGLVKVHGHKSPQNVKIWSKLWRVGSFFCPAWATQYTNPDKVNPVSIDHWPMPNLAQTGSLRMLSVLQLLGDFYSFSFLFRLLS